MNIFLNVILGLIGYAIITGFTKSIYNDIDDINIFKYKITLTEKMTSVIALLWPITFPLILIFLFTCYNVGRSCIYVNNTLYR